MLREAWALHVRSTPPFEPAAPSNRLSRFGVAGLLTVMLKQHWSTHAPFCEAVTQTCTISPSAAVSGTVTLQGIAPFAPASTVRVPEAGKPGQFVLVETV